MRRILRVIQRKEVLVFIIRPGLILGSLIGLWMMFLFTQLPSVEELEDPNYSLPSVIYDRNGQKVSEVFVKRRQLITYDKIPEHLILGLIAKEDSRFFSHFGIDILRIVKAALVNLISLQVSQGASTLTQQTARQFFLTLEKTWVRKAKEALLALKIEQQFSKEEIITLYLNKVNFGDAWGVSAASLQYFGKEAGQLSLSEASVLVGLLPAPNRYKPTRNLRLSRVQRDIVLARMLDEDFINQTEHDAAVAEPIVLVRPKYQQTEEAVSYYVELVRRELLQRFGSSKLYEGGLRVYTAMDLKHQQAAHKALVSGARRIDRRQGWRGPLDLYQWEGDTPPKTVVADLNPHLPPYGAASPSGSVTARARANARGVPKVGEVLKALVIEVEPTRAKVALAPNVYGIITWKKMRRRWRARLYVTEKANSKPQRRLGGINSLSSAFKVGHVVEVIVLDDEQYPQKPKLNTVEVSVELYQEPEVNGALYASKPHTGEVLALVGGVRYGKKDGGSEFIRATQSKRQPGSSFKPIVYAAALDEHYNPSTLLEDSPRTFNLSTGRKHTPENYDKRFLGALSLRDSLSRSRNVPTIKLVEEIGPHRIIQYARKLGITTDIPEEILIGLGTHSVRLSELTRAYGVFAAAGQLAKPIYILRVEDNKGNVLFEQQPEVNPVISADTAYLVTDILRDVIRSPNGTARGALGGFGRPVAGKTGTTQNYSDAWFLGYIPQLVAGIYMGMDNPSISLGPNESGSYTAAPIWRDYMNTVKSDLPIQGFEQPKSVVLYLVDAQGGLVSSCDQASGARYELFKVGAVSQRLHQQECNTFDQIPSTTKERSTPTTPADSEGPAL